MPMLIPLNNNVLLKLIKTQREQKTTSGLIAVVDYEYSGDDPELKGEVLSIGDAVSLYHETLSLNIGDTVLYKNTSENKPQYVSFLEDPEVYVLIDASDLVAKVLP